MRALLVLIMLSGCGATPVAYSLPDAGTDAGACVVCEGEDGAQFAESTLEWAPIACSRSCP